MMLSAPARAGSDCLHSYLSDARCNVIWGPIRHDKVEVELVLDALQRRIDLILEDAATQRGGHARGTHANT
jgi:hypothetical protein